MAEIHLVKFQTLAGPARKGLRVNIGQSLTYWLLYFTLWLLSNFFWIHLPPCCVFSLTPPNPLGKYLKLPNHTNLLCNMTRAQLDRPYELQDMWPPQTQDLHERPHEPMERMGWFSGGEATRDPVDQHFAH